MKKQISDFLVVIKYRTPDGLYDYKCFDEQDYSSTEELSADLENTKTEYEAEGCKIFWIREIIKYATMFEQSEGYL